MGREILFKAKSGVSGKWVEGLVFNAGNIQYIYTKPKSDGSRQEIYVLIRIRFASTLDSRIRMERRSGRMISLCAMIIRLIS